MCFAEKNYQKAKNLINDTRFLEYLTDKHKKTYFI